MCESWFQLMIAYACRLSPQLVGDNPQFTGHFWQEGAISGCRGKHFQTTSPCQRASMSALLLGWQSHSESLGDQGHWPQGGDAISWPHVRAQASIAYIHSLAQVAASCWWWWSICWHCRREDIRCPLVEGICQACTSLSFLVIPYCLPKLEKFDFSLTVVYITVMSI